ncbi:right-handed parallel beta-helix repeat-containing protein [bacterium]|nr:right-handed parallel beta-helix repeat-containing protein [bacterium]
MRLIVFSAILIAFLCIFAYAETHIPPGEVHGIWERTGSPFYIDGDINIPTDSMLIIKPGCTVIFTGFFMIIVDSNAALRAVGTEEARIYFTASDTTHPDSIGGLSSMLITYSEDVCSLCYCEFRYLRSVWVLDIFSSEHYISHCKISKCLNGIYMWDYYWDWAASVDRILDSCIISNNTGTPIYTEYICGSIVNTIICGNGDGIIYAEGAVACTSCTIERNGGIGIDFEHSDYNVYDCIIRYNDGAGVHCGGRGGNIENNTITNNNGAGVALSGCMCTGSAGVSSNIIANNSGIGITAPGLPLRGGGFSIYNNTISSNEGGAISVYEMLEGFLYIVDNVIVNNNGSEAIYLGLYEEPPYYLTEIEFEGNIIANRCDDELEVFPCTTFAMSVTNNCFITIFDSDSFWSSLIGSVASLTHYGNRFGTPVCASYVLIISPGWDLFSYPFADTTVLSEFYPSLLADGFTYDNPARRYEPVNPVSAGYGFWMLSDIDTVILISDRDYIDVVSGYLFPGWNLIGLPAVLIPVTDLTDLPGVIPPIYGYDGVEYFIADVLYPGKGYWILTEDTVYYELP